MTKSWTGLDTHSGRPITIHCAGGRITAIEPGNSTETGWLSPGLIDLQVNGYCGDDLNADDLTVETVLRLARRMLSIGVTTFLPTLITASEEKIIRNLRVIAAARAADPLLKQMIPCVHVEGPHISPEDGPRGAHPREHVRPPDVAEFRRWQAASGDLVGLITLSPHYESAFEYIRALSASGIVISLGHSSANADQIHAAAAAGARLSTHLGNGVQSMLPRHPNLIWAQLAEDRLTATLIADGYHLPADTLTAMISSKTVERSILVSDLVMLAGLPPGEYMTPVGGKVDLHPDGRLNVAGTGYLAGSTATLKDAVAYVATNTGLGLGDAITMATTNPGRVLGRAGGLYVGVPADFIRFRWQQGFPTLAIEEVIVQGESWE
jgi:N-acetylglucosamine-6-phosphate deacetylase